MKILDYIKKEHNFINPVNVLLMVNFIDPNYTIEKDNGALIDTIYELSEIKYTFDGAKYDYFINTNNEIEQL